MNAPLGEPLGRAPETSRRMQINTSPDCGQVDLSPLARRDRNASSFDAVSIADRLRNAAVYPPHPLYRDVKIAATGFDPAQDMFDSPRFHYPYQAELATSRPSMDAVDEEALLDTYHRLLCKAATRATISMRTPWLMQSGGKDSTSMAIALAEVRPDTTCLTYLGGKEEDEVASARFVARRLGLRHESLVCHPGRAYDRYLALLARIPLLTADFAALSYIDLATEVSLHQGDGIIDALGSDQYFGVTLHRHERVLAMMARGLHVPQGLFDLSPFNSSFKACFVLATLQMNKFERYFPGSRFSDNEVDSLFGLNVSEYSRQRMQTFHADVTAAASDEAVRRLSLVIGEAAHLAKGMNAAHAMSLHLTYPYADPRLRDWIFHHVPDQLLIGPDGTNKVLMRKYIARYFEELPYVKTKGCFRFDLRGLARQRYDQVYAFAQQMQTLLPGAPHWLEKHRQHLGNKFFASKFYLLAVILPWLLNHMRPASAPTSAALQEKVAS